MDAQTLLDVMHAYAGLGDAIQCQIQAAVDSDSGEEITGGARDYIHDRLIGPLERLVRELPHDDADEIEALIALLLGRARTPDRPDGWATIETGGGCTAWFRNLSTRGTGDAGPVDTFAMITDDCSPTEPTATGRVTIGIYHYESDDGTLQEGVTIRQALAHASEWEARLGAPGQPGNGWTERDTRNPVH